MRSNHPSQKLEQLRAAEAARGVLWHVAKLILLRQRGAGGLEHVHEVLVAELAGDVEGGAPVVLLLLDGGTVGEQQLDLCWK